MCKYQSCQGKITTDHNLYINVENILAGLYSNIATMKSKEILSNNSLHVFMLPGLLPDGENVLAHSRHKFFNRQEKHVGTILNKSISRHLIRHRSNLKMNSVFQTEDN